MKTIICVLIVLGLMLIPNVASAKMLEPTCYPPEEWYDEYCEWLAWQMELQRDYTNETGYGLGLMPGFSQWAELREVNEPYWWLPAPTPVPTICWQGYSYLFCDSNGEQRTTQHEEYIESI